MDQEAVRYVWRYGCPKNLVWDEDIESWTASEGTSSEQCEHNVESLAPNGMETSRELAKGGFELMLCQEMHDAW